MRSTANLRLLTGGISFTSPDGEVFVHPDSNPSRPTVPTSAEVVEEDTCLVLSTPTHIELSEEHPIRLMTDVIDYSPPPLGEVLVRGNGPYRMLAIVHDFDREPSWSEETVSAALGNVMQAAAARNIADLGLEMLGCIHGRLAPARFITLLRTAIAAQSLGVLRHIWLRGPRV